MKNFTKKATCFLLALLLCAGTILATPVKAKAETEPQTLYVSSGSETAEAGIPVNHMFTVPQAGQVEYYVITAAPVAFTLTLKDSTGADMDSYSVTASDSYWMQDSSGVWMNGTSGTLSAGDYSIDVTFDAATNFMLGIAYYAPDAQISNKKLTLTAGFTKTLKVTGADGDIKWKSSKTSVATVDKNGKVKAKKAGKTTITATTADGQTLKCTVTVKANKYSATKIKCSDYPYGDAGWEAYSASYSSNGDLVIKLRIANNSGHNIEYLKNLSVKVKSGNGKTVGTYKSSKLTIYCQSGSTKDCTVTIRKSALKNKNADLRNCKITTDGQYGYTYYY